MARKASMPTGLDQFQGFTLEKYVCHGKEVLGRGSFATVYKGTNTETGENVAVKVVDLARLTKDTQSLLSHFRKEIEIMMSLQHPNIVAMYDVKITENYIYMVLEYCNGGDFSKYVAKNKKINESGVRLFMRDLASGLEFLRSKNLIHRDLKPQNLLLNITDEKIVLKIADFGFARFIDPTSLADTICGSPLYMAPEILQLQKYNIKADLWSVGAIMFEMLFGHPPYPALSSIELLRMIDSSPVRYPQSASQLSSPCLNLLRSLLQRDPVARITWEEFFLHPWIGLHQMTDIPLPVASPRNSTPMTIPLSQQSLPVGSPMSQSPAVPIPTRSGSTRGSNASPPSPSSSPSPNRFNPFGTSPSPNDYLVSPRTNNRPLSTTNPNLPGVEALSSPRTRSTTTPVNLPLANAYQQPRGRSVTAPPTAQQVQPQLSPSSNEGTGTATRGRSNSIKGESYTSAIPMPKTNPFKDKDGSSQQVNKQPLYGMPSRESLSVSPERGFPIAEVSEHFEEFKNDFDARGRRAMAVASIADTQVEADRLGEAMSLYLKALLLLKNLIQNGRKLQSVNDSITNTVARYRERYTEFLRKVEYIKAQVKTNQVYVIPEKLMYDTALKLGRDGAIEEMYKNYEKAEQFYATGLLLLEQLFSEATDEQDKMILQGYLSGFTTRLNQTRSTRR